MLSAHRGLPSAALFTDLDQLTEGDKFFIHVLDRAMAYQVGQILAVEPTQTESLSIALVKIWLPWLPARPTA